MLQFQMVAFVIFLFASWITHIVVCIESGAWGFLIAGALFIPVGVIHGAGRICGAW